jgi:hypothetical protein
MLGDMQSTPNPHEASHSNPADKPAAPSFVSRFFVYAVLAFTGLFLGSFISVHVGDAWYPEDAEDNYISATIAAVLSSPIAMTFGLFPSLGFYGPVHGLLMLIGMLLTMAGTWLHFRSRRFAFAWVVFVGMILWSHNNHLAVAAIMSV